MDTNKLTALIIKNLNQELEGHPDKHVIISKVSSAISKSIMEIAGNSNDRTLLNG